MRLWLNYYAWQNMMVKSGRAGANSSKLTLNIVFHELLIGIQLQRKKVTFFFCINNFSNISVPHK